MPEFMPMFPLQLVVYPGQDLNLHIFEPRYKELVGECLEEDKVFGIPTYMNGEVQEYGTVVNIEKLEKTYDNGEMDIRTRGVQVFRLLEFLKELPNKQYPGAVVSLLDPPKFDKKGIYDKVADMVRALHQSIGLNEPVFKDMQSLQSFDLVKYIGMNLAQQYDLLAIKSEAQRQGYILEHLKRMVPSVKEAELLRERIQANGYFKREIPPEL
jgi:hypothetical protein